MFNILHGLQSILHIAQVGISYFLMLSIMTYNSWIIGTIILGSGVGYFVLGFKRQSTIDVNEHCN
jgi:solute carrier family 31 (copper transporter), member 1